MFILNSEFPQSNTLFLHYTSSITTPGRLVHIATSTTFLLRAETCVGKILQNENTQVLTAQTCTALHCMSLNGTFSNVTFRYVVRAVVAAVLSWTCKHFGPFEKVKRFSRDSCQSEESLPCSAACPVVVRDPCLCVCVLLDEQQAGFMSVHNPGSGPRDMFLS